MGKQRRRTRAKASGSANGAVSNSTNGNTSTNSTNGNTSNNSTNDNKNPLDELIPIDDLQGLMMEFGTGEMAEMLNSFLSKTKKGNKGEELGEVMRKLRLMKISLRDPGYLPLLSQIYQDTEEHVEAWIRSGAMEPLEVVEHALKGSQMLSQYLGLSEKQYFASLKAANDQRIVKMLAKNTVKGLISHEKQFLYEEEGGQLKPILKVLDPKMRQFFEENPGLHSAVDLASGAATYPVAYSDHFGPHNFGCGDDTLPMDENNVNKLFWIPTEFENPNGERNPLEMMRNCLFCHEEMARKSLPEGFVLEDSNSIVVFKGDKVKLHSLNNDRYNGKVGVVSGIRDPKDKDRFAVRLVEDGKSLSLKARNLKRYESRTADRNRWAANAPGRSKARRILDMGGCSKCLDLEDTNTWNNVDAQSCALVTCTSLLTQVGQRCPKLWKESVRLASRLLKPGGYFLQYDSDLYGNFGNQAVMQSFAKSESLGMDIELCEEPIKYGPGSEVECGKLVLVLWKKV